MLFGGYFIIKMLSFFLLPSKIKTGEQAKNVFKEIHLGWGREGSVTLLKGKTSYMLLVRFFI